MNFLLKISIITTISCLSLVSWGQMDYNNCNQALELCPNKTFSVNNIAANSTLCPGCEDDFNNCFNVEKSIWLKFETNATGGDIQIDFTNLVFENQANLGFEAQATLIEAPTPCSAASYIFLGNCVSNATTDFNLTATNLNPNTTYYIVLDGNHNGPNTFAAELTTDVQITGPAVDRPISTVSLSVTSNSICLNETIAILANTTNCPDVGMYYWFVNGVLAATTTDAIFHTSELQDGDIVSVETSCYAICMDTVSSVTQPFSVYSFPIDAGPDVTINKNTSVQLTATTTANVFSWTPDFLLNDPNSLTPFASPTQTTVFTFSATENGCTLYDYVTITIQETLKVPNTISPNGDGSNDVWLIEGINEYPENLVKIFSRWGQLVFQARSYSTTKTWDGSLKSGEVAEGVYFYVIDLGNGEIINGSLTVLR